MLFNETGLGVHPKQNGEVLPLERLSGLAPLNIVADELGFLTIIGHRDEAHFFPAVLSAPEVFGAASGIVANENVGGL